MRKKSNDEGDCPLYTHAGDEKVSAKKQNEKQKQAPSPAGTLAKEKDWLPGLQQSIIFNFLGYPQREPTIGDSKPKDQDTKASTQGIQLIIKEEKKETLNSNSLAFFTASLHTRRTTLLGKLLVHVVSGEEKQAQAMIQQNPDLAFDINQRITVIDYSGREITDCSAWQYALRAGDVEMAERMVAEAKDSDVLLATMQTQFNKVFPPDGDVQAYVEAQQKDTFDFESIFNAIQNASDGEVTAALKLKGTLVSGKDYKQEKGQDVSPLTKVLNQFRYDFTQRAHAQKIFNPYDLLKAFQTYVDKFDEFRGVNQWNKRDLFWRQVIGFVQRFLPTCYAQGLICLTSKEGREDLRRRSLKFSCWKLRGVSILPLKSSGVAGGLGFHFAAGGGMNGKGGDLFVCGRTRRLLSKIISSKKDGFRRLCRPTAEVGRRLNAG